MTKVRYRRWRNANSFHIQGNAHQKNPWKTAVVWTKKSLRHWSQPLNTPPSAFLSWFNYIYNTTLMSFSNKICKNDSSFNLEEKIETIKRRTLFVSSFFFYWRSQQPLQTCSLTEPSAISGKGRSFPEAATKASRQMDFSCWWNCLLSRGADWSSLKLLLSDKRHTPKNKTKWKPIRWQQTFLGASLATIFF